MEYDVKSLIDLLCFIKYRFYIFILAFVGVYLLSRLMQSDKMTARKISRKATLLGMFGFIVTLILFLLIIIFFKNDQSGAAGKMAYGLPDIFSQLILFIIISIPIFTVLISQKESLETTGLTSRNWVSALVIGLFLSILALQPGTTYTALIHDFKSIYIQATIYWLVVGFSEEFIFRGFLQTRLTALTGKWTGLTLASIIFAFSHVAIRYFWEGFSLEQSFYNCLSILPLSFLLGYTFLRTGNIIAPGLLHTFVNLSQTFQEMSRGY